MLHLNFAGLCGLILFCLAYPVFGQSPTNNATASTSGRRLVPSQVPNASREPTASALRSTETFASSTPTGSRPKTVYARAASDSPLNMTAGARNGGSNFSGSVASTKTQWLPPLAMHTNPVRTSSAATTSAAIASPLPTSPLAINPSLPRYDTRVANNQRFKPATTSESTVVQSSFYAPQPPSMPTFPGGTYPPGSTAPPPTSSAQPGTFPPSGGLPTFGGSGSSFSDSPSSGPPGVSSPPQPLIPGGGVSGGTSTLPSAPPTSGIRSATPPAASYPMPGIAGQGSVPAGGGTLPGATPMTNMANPNNGLRGGVATPSNTPRYATGEPFVTNPPPQIEMPYTHATVANNSCLPGWFQSSSTPVATTPTAPMNNTTSGVYPANTYPTNPATANPNGYPGVPGYIVPPTVTQNMAPQMFSPNNNGYTPLVNWGTESNNVTIGRGMFGGPTVYVNDEPVRNFFRYVFH